MHGIIIIDKPSGYTSRDIVNEVSHKLHTKKVGHTGTLDPLATGVLVLCVGDYTKFVSTLVDHDKEYLVGFQFGRETDTLDVTGSLLKTSEVIPSKEQLEEVLSSFMGKQKQEVPIYSAKKVNGKRLYEYAREASSVELPVQEIEIYDLKLLDYQNGEGILSCHVSKGTYIRSLIRDISYQLGTLGVMTTLRRTRLGNFSLSQAISFEDLNQQNDFLLDFRSIVAYEIYEAHETDLKIISHANELYLDFSCNYVLITYSGREIALYQRHQNRYKPLIMFDKNSSFL